MSKNITSGKIGEEKAIHYLENLGYKIVAKNYRCKLGEVDIIARDKDILVFVEVKMRTTILFGHPIDAIGYKKLNSIIKTSQYYLKFNNFFNIQYRVDAIEVLVLNGNVKINHITNITI